MEQIRLDIIPKGLMPVCHSSQYDKGRVIRLNLVDGLQGYTLTDETVTLNVRKPDNNIVTAGVNVISGASYVDIVTTEQMTACEGENLCEIVITKGDVKIASLNFKMKVEVDPLKDGIESETEIHNLETQIAEIDAEIVPPIVAEEVANQYDSENVIFDDTPTASHGTGYTVTSEGIKNYVDNKPNALVDLTDVDIDNPTSNQALVWDTTEQKWVNGEVSTVGGLNDLNDVTIDDTSLEQGQELVYNNTAEVFENKTTRVELTQAEYDALANPLPDVDYYITDAPSMQGTSADLSYDGDTESVHDVVEEVKSDVADLDTNKADEHTIENVSLTCPRCPISSLSNTTAYGSGKIYYYASKIEFGATGESTFAYLTCSLFANVDYVMGYMYDNDNDRYYSIGKGNSTSLWVFSASANRTPANTFAGKQNIYINLIGIKV